MTIGSEEWKAVQHCKTCGELVYMEGHDGGCPTRLSGLYANDDGVIIEVEVVWHGGIPDQYGGFTTGELLAPYDKPRRE